MALVLLRALVTGSLRKSSAALLICLLVGEKEAEGRETFSIYAIIFAGFWQQPLNLAQWDRHNN